MSTKNFRRADMPAYEDKFRLIYQQESPVSYESFVEFLDEAATNKEGEKVYATSTEKNDHSCQKIPEEQEKMHYRTFCSTLNRSTPTGEF